MGFWITDTERDHIFNQIECSTDFKFEAQKGFNLLLLSTMTAFQILILLFLYILELIKLIYRIQIDSYSTSQQFSISFYRITHFCVKVFPILVKPENN